jgi:hypothetical protein
MGFYGLVLYLSGSVFQNIRLFFGVLHYYFKSITALIQNNILAQTFSQIEKNVLTNISNYIP